jgi:hypothetical protein
MAPVAEVPYLTAIETKAAIEPMVMYIMII